MKKTSSEPYSMAESLSLVFELGYKIALPLVFMAILGRWADQKLGTHPLFLLLGILLAFLSSCFLIYKMIVKIMQPIQNELHKKEKEL